METLENILAQNLTALRKKHHWTQAELAEKLHYSDKSISKWERGESLPDLKVMKTLSELYGVSVDFLMTEHTEADLNEYVNPKSQTVYRVLASLLTVSVVWLVATVFYTYSAIRTGTYMWQIFIWAIPASCLVLLFYVRRWFRGKGAWIIASVMLWTLIAAVYLQRLDLNMWLLFIIGIPAQLTLILTTQIRRIR